MDGRQFDALARAFGASQTRRSALRLLAGGLVASAGGVLRARGSAAAAPCSSRVPTPGFVSTPNGCGTANFPISSVLRGGVDITNACNAHDSCYDACTGNQHGCDHQFLVDMQAMCTANTPAKSTDRKNCLADANTYYHGVATFGGIAYADAQQAACTCCKSTERPCGGSCCPPDQCKGGTCVACKAPMENCGGHCVAACPDGFVRDGNCRCVCPAPTVRCGIACVDPSTDDANCGHCGRSCADGSHCVAGECQACPEGQKQCLDARCHDCCFDNDCSGGRTCQDGVCACPASTRPCGSTCCPSARPCCEHVCCTGGSMCASDGGCCGAHLGTCHQDGDCCTGDICPDGVCCTGPSGACVSTSDCCFGACQGGHCCLNDGGFCGSGNECCSGICGTEGTCKPSCTGGQKLCGGQTCADCCFAGDCAGGGCISGACVSCATLGKFGWCDAAQQGNCICNPDADGSLQCTDATDGCLSTGPSGDCKTCSSDAECGETALCGKSSQGNLLCFYRCPR